MVGRARERWKGEVARYNRGRRRVERLVCAGASDKDERRGAMALITSVADVFETLGRDPAELIGVPEADFVDFKRTAYRFKSDRGRFELAKDVSAMANTERAGVIVLGIETERNPRLQQDVAVRLRPVASGLVDVQQVQHIIWEWVYPRLDVAVRSHAVKNRAGALWTIRIDRQRERDLPFIVAREFIGQRGATRNLFGAYKRHSTHNAPYPCATVHGWLRQGWAGPVLGDTSIGEQDDTQGEKILEDDLAVIGVGEGQAYYYLQARPEGRGPVANFYRGGARSIYESMRNIRHMRPWGFHLADKGEPARTEWDGLRVVRPGVSSISVSRNDGLTTAVMGQYHLTWASERFAPKGQWVISPLVLVEFTLEFCRFYLGQTAGRVGGRRGTEWRAGMQGVREPEPLLLPDKPLSDRSFLSPAEGHDFRLRWARTDESDPGRLAFAVLTEVYAQFGLGEALIPYADGKRISEEAIREA
jgi:hypothetical protein